MKKESTLPALDDQELRELNSKKVMTAVDNLSGFLEEGRKNAKASKYYLIFMLLLLGFMIFGAVIAVAIKSGGISAFFDNFFITENINKRIVCKNEYGNMSFRTAAESYYFIKTFDVETNCIITDKKTEQNEHNRKS